MNKALPNENSDLRKWERVEIERSDSEASHQDLSQLKVNETQIERYMNPLEGTVYPLEFAYHLLGDVRGKRVLDFGCGNGENTILLARRGGDVFSMDISTESIKVAEKRLQINGSGNTVKFFTGSAHDIPLADESVDVVFGMAILHHLDLKLAAKEVFRVLKKGGRAIFQEPVRNSKFVWFVRNLIPYQQPDLSPYERPLTDDELKDFAAEFSAYKSRAFALPYLNLTELFTGNEKLLHPLRAFDRKVLQTIKPLNYYASIRIVEMTK
ncbi:MAG TPA: class I SAM-dependent methyltransferase [Pyrinomonadaceae bacterium]|nr:class I SAM-dependent methyltransferase [Pyrinomonadaceae bacterium]